MTDISGAWTDSQVTIPVEGRRKTPISLPSAGGQILPTERTAAVFVIAALGAVWVLRKLFDGALGD